MTECKKPFIPAIQQVGPWARDTERDFQAQLGLMLEVTRHLRKRAQA